MAAFWNNPRRRGVFYQLLAVAGVAALMYWLADNTVANLARQGKTAGFDFLNDTAGFGINFHLIEYRPDSPIIRVFAVGVVNTLVTAALSVVFATLLGFLVGGGRLSRNFLLRRICDAFVEVFRNIPLLLQMFFWYFAVLRQLPPPSLSLAAGGGLLNNRGLYLPRPIFAADFTAVAATLGIAVIAAVVVARLAKRRQMRSGRQFPTLAVAAAMLILPAAVFFFAAESSPSWELPILRGFNVVGGMWLPPEFVAVVFGLSIYTAAFIAENVRAGILSVDGGISEAAAALGFRRPRAMRLFVIPLAMRAIIPPLTNQYLNIVKNSSLAVAIAFPELVSVFAGTALNQTGREIEIIFMTMMFYLSVSLSISLLMNWFNRKYALH